MMLGRLWRSKLGLGVLALLVGSVVLFAPHAVRAQDADANQVSAKPVTVQVGAYVLRLNNVSQKDGTFDVDLWVWFRWQDKDAKPYESFEIANGSIKSKSNAVVSDDNGFNYTSIRVQATIFHDYDVRHFPLDDHRLTIEIEDENIDENGLVYLVDDGIALDPGVDVAGWDVKLGKATIEPHLYPTNYGLRSSGQDSSTYSRFVLPIYLERTSMLGMFKQFWISALSVLLGLLAFRVKATDLDARFGLGVGSIFAASANAFVITDNLPKTTAITLAEQINFVAIATIFISVFLSIASLRRCYAGHENGSERLDRNALAILGIVYVIVNLALVVWQA